MAQIAQTLNPKPIQFVYTLHRGMAWPGAQPHVPAPKIPANRLFRVKGFGVQGLGFRVGHFRIRGWDSGFGFQTFGYFLSQSSQSNSKEPCRPKEVFIKLSKFRV